MSILSEHRKDCSPLIPCTTCELVAWLRSKLSEEDFNQLSDRIQYIDSEPKRRRGNRRRKTREPDLLDERTE